MKKLYTILTLCAATSFPPLEGQRATAQQDLTFTWAKQLGGTSSEGGRSVALDAVGNVYTTGYFSGTADFDPGAGAFNLTSGGGSDIFISKLDPSGNFVWAKAMGGIGNELGRSVALDTAGNVYTTGWFYGTADFDPGAGTFNLTSAGNNDIFISKLDPSGNFVWAKAMGGINYDEGHSVALDTAGNVYTTGYFQDTADFDPGAGAFNLTSAGSYDIFISKLDTSGNFVWAKAMGATDNDYGYSVVLDAAGNVYTTGVFRNTVDFDPGAGVFNLTSAGSVDIFISKLDPFGNFVWAKAMGGTGSDYGNSVATDAAGNVYTTGWFQVTADFDPGAGAFNLTSSGGGDIFISKLDVSGNFVWAKALGGTSSDIGRSVAPDAVGNVYTTGDFYGTADFDPGAGTVNLTSAGGGDFFISKLDPSGNFVWAKAMGGTGDDYGISVALDTAGNVYTTGDFYGTVDFDPGAGAFNLTSAGSWDVFVAKYSQCNTTSSFTSTAVIICESDTVSFTNTSASAITYQWLENGIPFSTATDTARTFNTAGTYIISLIADSGSCSDSSGVIITVSPTYTITDSAVSICTGDSVSIYGIFQINAGTYYDSLTTSCGLDSIHSTALTINPTYTITDPAASICTGDSALIYGTYRTTAGTYYDSLTTISGCDSVHSTILSVNPTYTITDPAVSICTGDSALIYGTYRTTAATYYDSLTTADGCDSIFSTALTVNPLPPKPTVSQSGDTLESGTAVSYQWYYDDTLIIGGTSQFYIPAQSGFYSVEITDANGCSAMSDPFSVTISGIESPQGFPRLIGAGLIVFPNPNTGELTIKFNTQQTETITIKIYNPLGQVIFEDLLKKFKGGYEKRLDLNRSPAGIYNLTLDNGKMMISRMVIVERVK